MTQRFCAQSYSSVAIPALNPTFGLNFYVLMTLFALFVSGGRGDRAFANQPETSPGASPAPAAASKDAHGAASPAPAAAGAPPPAAGAHGNAGSPGGSGPGIGTKIKPTRTVSLPEFSIFTNVQKFLGEEKSKKTLLPKETPFDASKNRYNVVLGIATWSERAKEVGKFFQDKLPELKTRKIGIVGLFTHDSYEDIAKMVSTQGYTFSVAKADLQFVEKLLNPKIPTIWITDHRGQVVYRLVRPTTEGIAQVYQYLLAWTDF